MSGKRAKMLRKVAKMACPEGLKGEKKYIVSAQEDCLIHSPSTFKAVVKQMKKFDRKDKKS